MIIAKKKKEENIAEYVLYMWQIEDLIRAAKLDMNLLEKQIIQKYDTDDETIREIREWYNGLIRQMNDEKKTEKGHLQFLINQVNDLYDYHIYLLNDDSEKTYHQVYDMARPNLDQFRRKSDDNKTHDVELAFNALYSLMLMRLQGKKVNEETEKAMTSFSNFLGMLSAKYLSFHKGEEELKT